MKEIMQMPNGTILEYGRTGAKFELGDWVNNVARKLKNLSYAGRVDYINRMTQGEYRIVEADYE